MTNPLAQDLGGVVLLPCPFCGAEMNTSEGGLPWHPLNDGTRSFCIIGGMSIYTHHIGLWNTRTHSAEIAGALRDAERWQPVETAPKDGRRVMLYDPDRVPSELIAHFANRAWWGDMTNSGRSIVWRDATHWRPLPAPPTQDSAMQQGGGGSYTDPIHTGDCRSHDDGSVCDCGALQQR